MLHLLVFHAYINEMHSSRSKIPSVARRDLIPALNGYTFMNTHTPHSNSAGPSQCLHNAYQRNYMKMYITAVTTFLESNLKSMPGRPKYMSLQDEATKCLRLKV
jgi:hypothetical protein